MQIREGFIIDDDEDEPEERERRRKKDRKRRRAEREEEEAVLDEEDLDLIGEANPEWERKAASQVGNTGCRGICVTDKPAAKIEATKAWPPRRWGSTKRTGTGRHF